MTEAEKIKKNTFFSLVSTVSRLIANSILLIIINNIYGKEIAGQLVTANVISGLFIVFADFGLDLLLTTEVARDGKNSNRIFCGLLPAKVLLSLISIILLLILIYYYNFSIPTKVLLIIFSFYTVLMILNNFFSAFFRGLEKFLVDAKISLISNFTLLVFVLFFSFMGYSIYFIAISYVISRMVGLLSYIFFFYKVEAGFKFKLELGYIFKMRKKVFVFGTHLVFQNIFAQMDTLFLQYWIGDVAVGIYQGAARIFSMPLVLSDILLNAFTPTLSRYYLTDRNLWTKLGFILNKTLIYISIPFAILFLIYPDKIIGLIYFNKDFTQSIEILRFFGILLLLRFATDTSGIMLTTSNQQDVRMKLVTVFTLISLPIFYFFVSHYGIVGSIKAQIVTNGLLGLAFIVFSFSYVKKWFIANEVLLVLFISIILFVIVLKLSFISFFITIPVLSIIYTLIVLRKGYKPDEKEFLIPTINNISKLFQKMKTKF